MSDTKKTFNEAVQQFSDAVTKAFQPFFEALKNLLPFMQEAKIRMDIAEIIDRVYKRNQIEYMFDSESIKRDLIEEVAQYITSNHTPQKK